MTTTQSEVCCRIRLGGREMITQRPTYLQKRREMIIDLLITIGIPVLQMILRKRYSLSIFPMNSI